MLRYLKYALFCILCIGALYLYAMEQDHYSELPNATLYARPGAYNKSLIVQRTQSAPTSPQDSDNEYEETVAIVPVQAADPVPNNGRRRKDTMNEIKDADSLELSDGLIMQINKGFRRNLDTLNSQLHEALFPARGFANIKKAEALVRAGADVNAVNKQGDPFILEAAAKRSGDVLHFLVQHDVRINKKGSRGMTALHKAVFDLLTNNGDISVVRFLINNGADTNIADEAGTLPIFHVAFILHPGTAIQIARLLIDGGAQLSLRNARGQTVIDFANELGNKEELVRFLSGKLKEQEEANRIKKLKEKDTQLVY